MQETFENPETFLELYVTRAFSEAEKKQYGDITLAITFEDRLIELGSEEDNVGTVRMMTFSKE